MSARQDRFHSKARRPKMSNGSPVLEFHVCLGLNSCAGHGVNGSGTQPGDGSCATSMGQNGQVGHGCSGLNACRGQGGCGNGPYETQMDPGQNACVSLGACASPIGDFNGTAKPDFTWTNQDGPNKGNPVWCYARALFEQRMKAAGKSFGAAPPGASCPPPIGQAG